MGAVGAAVHEKVRKSRVPLGIVPGPGVHDPQSEAPDLVGEQAQIVRLPGLVPVALQQRRPAQGVHRVADHAEHATVPPFPGLPGVGGGQGAVELVLGHAHVPALYRRVRHKPGGAEEEHIAVKYLLRRDNPHLGRGDGDLAQLKLPPLRDVLPDVAEPQCGDHVPA